MHQAIALNTFYDKVSDGYKEEADQCLQNEFTEWLMGEHPANAWAESAKQMAANGQDHGTGAWGWNENKDPDAPVRYQWRKLAGGIDRESERDARDNTWVSTPWGATQLTHLPEVREKLRADHEATKRAQFKMNVLAEFGPQNLDEAWMYFKHWVKGRPVKAECFPAHERDSFMGGGGSKIAGLRKGISVDPSEVNRAYFGFQTYGDQMLPREGPAVNPDGPGHSWNARREQPHVGRMSVDNDKVDNDNAILPTARASVLASAAAVAVGGNPGAAITAAAVAPTVVAAAADPNAGLIPGDADYDPIVAQKQVHQAELEVYAKYTDEELTSFGMLGAKKAQQEKLAALDGPDALKYVDAKFATYWDDDVYAYIDPRNDTFYSDIHNAWISLETPEQYTELPAGVDPADAVLTEDTPLTGASRIASVRQRKARTVDFSNIVVTKGDSADGGMPGMETLRDDAKEATYGPNAKRQPGGGNARKARIEERHGRPQWADSAAAAASRVDSTKYSARRVADSPALKLKKKEVRLMRDAVNRKEAGQNIATLKRAAFQEPEYDPFVPMG